MVDECDQATTTSSTALMNTENDENGTVDYTHASVSSLSSDSDSGNFLFFNYIHVCDFYFFLDGVQLDSYSESNLFDTSSPFEQGMTKFAYTGMVHNLGKVTVHVLLFNL